MKTFLKDIELKYIIIVKIHLDFVIKKKSTY